MGSPSYTFKELSLKFGATPYRLESPCALMIGGKLLVVSPEPDFSEYQQPRCDTNG
jgi:hypothetical protein